MGTHAGVTGGRNGAGGPEMPGGMAHGCLCFLPAAGVPGPPVRGSAPAAARGNAALKPDLPAVPAAHASGHPGERGGVSKGWQRLEYTLLPSAWGLIIIIIALH